jgi:myosin heavy subunit
MASVGPWHWVRSSEDAWAAGRLVQTTAAGRTYDVGGALRIVPDADIGPPIHHPAGLGEDFDDMVKMEDVNEATILHNLRLRFAEQRIYTGIGDVLVSLNPFQNLPIYEPADVERYHSLRAGEEAPPHLFMVANNAYKGLTELRHDQSIIISGESGAGKTEVRLLIYSTLYCSQGLQSAPAAPPSCLSHPLSGDEEVSVLPCGCRGLFSPECWT